MFKINDYVINASSGVCQITDITKDESNSAEYYILHPIYQNNMTIKIPVQNASLLIKPILTKNEVLTLIANIPNIKPLSINDNKERSNFFKSALKTRNKEDLITVIKTLFLERQDKSFINKKLTRANEDIMNAAEKQLYEEFAIALDISPDKVGPYISDYISSLGK